MTELPPIVGRHTELAALERLIGPHGPRVAWVHGVGGIGKSWLVRAFAARHGAAWHDALALPALDALATGVVVVDGAEQAPGLAQVLRRRVLPSLGPDARLVVTSREAPDPRWGADCGPGGFVAIAVDALDDADANALLVRWGVTEADRSQLIGLCHGHPLLLAMAAQLPSVEAFVADGLDAAPELLGALVEALDASPPDLADGDALVVAAIAWRTTEPLLRAVVGPNAREVFDALRAFNGMIVGRDGLHPHDLVRDAVRADAKWRDRERYDRLFRAVASWSVAEVRRRGADALPDLLYLLADNPLYRRIAGHRHAAAPGPMVATSDLDVVRPILEPHVGPATWARMAAWHASGDLAFHLMFDEAGEPAEAITTMSVEALTGDAPTDDPAVLAGRALLGPLAVRPGARITFSRGAAHPVTGMASPLANARILAAAMRFALDGEPPVAMGSVIYPVEVWRPMMEHLRGISSYQEIVDGDRAFLVQFQDLRVVDVAGWLEMQLYPPEVDVSADVVTLDRDEFELAVREALRLYLRVEVGACRLARTPLVWRAAPHADPAARADALRGLLAGALDALDDARAAAAVRRTYLEPATKQYAVAVELGLTFPTYRRALAAGVAAVTEALWRAEARS